MSENDDSESRFFSWGVVVINHPISTELGDGGIWCQRSKVSKVISTPGIIQQVHDVPEIPGAHLIAMLMLMPLNGFKYVTIRNLPRTFNNKKLFNQT